MVAMQNENDQTVCYVAWFVVIACECPLRALCVIVYDGNHISDFRIYKKVLFPCGHVAILAVTLNEQTCSSVSC